MCVREMHSQTCVCISDNSVAFVVVGGVGSIITVGVMSRGGEIGHLPEWKVDRDGTFLGNATGCLEELTAGVRLLRFTML